MFETANENLAERIILVGTALGKMTREEAEYSLDELARLIDTAGGIEVGRFLQKRTRPDGAFFVRKRSVEELAGKIEETEADLVVFDHLL
ncbi:MAG: GTPase HflX, partial [FCB group bacterium]|nr:GTPase HflX [FCB group bacterium]